MRELSNQSENGFRKLIAEARGNALWDVLKGAGWLMSVALVTLIRWLQRSSTIAVVVVLFGFWAISLGVYWVLLRRQVKSEKSLLVLPAGVESSPRKIWPQTVAAGLVLAFVFTGTGFIFSLWFAEPKTLPSITLETLDGLPPTVANDPQLRLHRLIMLNASDVEIENLISRVQLPEPVYKCLETNSPAGTFVDWNPIIEPITVSGTGSKSIVGPASAVYHPVPHMGFFPLGAQGELFKASKETDMTGVWELNVSRLARHRSVSILFLTSNGPHASNYLELVNTEFITNGAQVTATTQLGTNGEVIIHNFSFTATLNNNTNYQFGTNGLKFSLEGNYQYQFEQRTMDQHFLVPVVYNSKQRRMSSMALQTTDGHWRRIIVEFQ